MWSILLCDTANSEYVFLCFEDLAVYERKGQIKDDYQCRMKGIWL